MNEAKDEDSKIKYHILSSDEEIKSTLTTIDSWITKKGYAPDLSINFYAGNDIFLSKRIKESLQNGICNLIKTSYPLIITSNNL